MDEKEYLNSANLDTAWIRDGAPIPAGYTPTGKSRHISAPEETASYTPRRDDEKISVDDESSDKIPTPHIEPSTSGNAETAVVTPSPVPTPEDRPAGPGRPSIQDDVRQAKDAKSGVDFWPPITAEVAKMGEWYALNADTPADAIDRLFSRMPSLPSGVPEKVVQSGLLEGWCEIGGDGWAMRSSNDVGVQLIKALRDSLYANSGDRLRGHTVEGERDENGRFTPYFPIAVSAKARRGKAKFGVLMDASRAVVEDTAMSFDPSRIRERAWIVAKGVTGRPPRIFEASIRASDFPDSLCLWSDFKSASGDKVQVRKAIPLPQSYGVSGDSVWADFRLPEGMTPGAVSPAGASAMRGLMGSKTAVVGPDPAARHLRVELPRSETRVAWGPAWVPDPEDFPRAVTQGGATAQNLVLPIGQALDGTPIFVDFDQSPHAFAVGGSGSGKTWVILSWLSALQIQGAEIVIGDPKGGGDYLDLLKPGQFPGVRSLATTMPEIALLVLWVADELENRKASLSEIGSLGYTGRVPYPPLVCVLDEMASLKAWASSAGDLGKEVLDAIDVILREGRSLRVFLIMATQSAYDKQIQLSWLENVGSKVVLRRPGRKTAETVLGTDEHNPVFYTIPDKKPGYGTVLTTRGGKSALLTFSAPHLWSPSKEKKAGSVEGWDAWRDQVRQRIPWSPRIAPATYPGWDTDAESIATTPMLALDSPSGEPRGERANFDVSSPAYIRHAGGTRRRIATIDD